MQIYEKIPSSRWIIESRVEKANVNKMTKIVFVFSEELCVSNVITVGLLLMQAIWVSCEILIFYVFHFR